jgi:ABC-type glycerol-3-phosphate transport system permease component
VVYVFLLALQTNAEAAAIPPTIFPAHPQLSNFPQIADRIPLGKYFYNSLMFSLSTTIAVLLTSLFAAYATTKLRMRGRELIISVFIGGVLIPPAIRAIPLYTMIARLGLVDTWAGLSLPMMATGFGLFFMHQFMKTLPDSVVEAARMDGCSEFRVVLQIIGPLAAPGLVTLFIYNFLFRWNDYLWPLVVTRRNWTTLPVGVSIFKTSEQLVTWNLIAAAAVVTLIPVLLLFFSIGGRIIKGIAFQASK